MQSVSVGNTATSNHVHKWKCPDSGRVKINVDVDVSMNDLWFFIGTIIRDSTRTFFQEKTMRFAGKISIFEVEARNVLEVLSWIETLGLYNVQVETNSLLKLCC